MEGKNHKFLLVIGVMLILIICGFVLFFMLDKTGILSKNGDNIILSNHWNIDIKVDNTKVLKDSKLDIETKKTDIKITGNIKKEDVVTYDLIVNNKGSIDAYLFAIVNSNEDLDISYKVDDKDLEIGTVLKSKEKIKVTLTISSKEDKDINLNNKLVFNQYNE